MILLLMAAGKGSRYGKLKQFDGLGPEEEFLMEFSIYDALQNDFDHIVVITQKNNVDFLRDYLSPRLPDGIRLDVLAQQLEDLPAGIEFDGERAKPWGTAHAVWTAREVIDAPFVVINADDYYGKNAYRNAAQFIRSEDGSDAFGLVAYTLKDTLSEHGSVSRGVCEQEGDQLLSVVERTKIQEQDNGIVDTDSGLTFTGEELVSMNFWVCQPTIFDQITKDLKAFIAQGDNLERGEVYLPFVIQAMLKSQLAEVKVIPSESLWFGVTYLDDKEKAMEKLQEMTGAGGYPSPLWPAVTV
ncbi:nucleotidyltransferase family protein [Lentiprolixibacter aurantiacus]|uniref:Sugar phosphate nucleotidyltransferase n=1 Tax=Lentiprolixibacter aurantiacus TaxID=2993939 RepID=A0AAE3SNX8_9FLAO|nr:sugar phosphate nucleotidyltransferase [Lentiprolixibacter aurantiacus]MCX2718937.1 sugar phosphate nucleotidyltransferase [Lentiprolixibacter aurantiacus]